jgi:hypothetical protein
LSGGVTNHRKKPGEPQRNFPGALRRTQLEQQRCVVRADVERDSARSCIGRIVKGGLQLIGLDALKKFVRHSWKKALKKGGASRKKVRTLMEKWQLSERDKSRETPPWEITILTALEVELATLIVEPSTMRGKRWERSERDWK